MPIASGSSCSCRRHPCRSGFLAILSCLLAAAPLVLAGDTTWQRNATWLQEQVGDCAGGEDPDACRYFPARALDRLFGIEQMCEGETCANHWQVAETVLEGDGWTELGSASDQAALSKARDMATGGLPVVAVYGGMVALVMPGQAVSVPALEPQRAPRRRGQGRPARRLDLRQRAELPVLRPGDRHVVRAQVAGARLRGSRREARGARPRRPAPTRASEGAEPRVAPALAACLSPRASCLAGLAPLARFSLP